jgi:hypothetical protein
MSTYCIIGNFCSKTFMSTKMRVVLSAEDIEENSRLRHKDSDFITTKNGEQFAV